MANELSKIERMGLANEVQDLLASGDYPTATAIAEKLRQTHDLDISDSAVQRYVAKVKDAVAPDAARKLREHVNQELPKDLDALEAIQRQAQAWWTEAPADTAERLARAFVEVDARVEVFASRIRGRSSPTTRTAGGWSRALSTRFPTFSPRTCACRRNAWRPCAWRRTSSRSS